jgi:membrane fusion protein, multidrug efflux system
MMKRMITMLIALAILFGLITGWYFLKKKKIHEFVTAMQNAVATISTATAQEKTWSPYLSSVGSLQAVNGVDVTTQSSGGIITSIDFDSGSDVMKDDKLVQIDDRLDAANLKDSQAQLVLAQQTYDRDNKLFKQGSVSKSQVDTDMASLNEAQATVEYDLAEIEYKTIVAPFDGRIGISQVNIGQYITAGTNIASLQSLDPLYVQFSLPEQNLSQVSNGQAITLTSEASPDHTYKGTITAIDSLVDTDTRSITVQATIGNDDMNLLPGMFSQVKVILPEQDSVVTLPQTAINYNLYGDSVYVVKRDGTDDEGKPRYKIKLKYVTVGERRGDEMQITKGVKEGEVVVSSGQLKLNDGDYVQINNSVEP